VIRWPLIGAVDAACAKIAEDCSDVVRLLLSACDVDAVFRDDPSLLAGLSPRSTNRPDTRTRH
jgi:hypothetical protein